MKDGHNAIGPGGEVDQAGRGIEFSGIDAFADGLRGDEATGGCVHNGHYTAAATDEHAVGLAIHIHTAGLFTGCKLPGVGDFECLGVDAEQSAEILHVQKQMAGVVGDGMFGATGEAFDRAHDFTCFGVFWRTRACCRGRW